MNFDHVKEKKWNSHVYGIDSCNPVTVLSFFFFEKGNDCSL